SPAAPGDNPARRSPACAPCRTMGRWLRTRSRSAAALQQGFSVAGAEKSGMDLFSVFLLLQVASAPVVGRQVVVQPFAAPTPARARALAQRLVPVVRFHVGLGVVGVVGLDVVQ